MKQREHRCDGRNWSRMLAAAMLVQAWCACSGAGAAESMSADSQPAAAKITAPVAGYELAWADEFDGTALDTNKWAYRTDSKHLSTQKPENVSMGEGKLKLALKKENAGGKRYTGAGIVSREAFRHGYYEARFKIPAGAGWHTAFWLMKHDGSGTTDAQDALQGLDIMENNSIDPNAYVVTVQKYNPLPIAVYSYVTIESPDLAADFHVFGCEFTPETVKFFLDGKVVHSAAATQFTHGDQNIWLTSIASHLGGTVAVADGKLPGVVECDYVRFFRAAVATSSTQEPR